MSDLPLFLNEYSFSIEDADLREELLTLLLESPSEATEDWNPFDPQVDVACAYLETELEINDSSDNSFIAQNSTFWQDLHQKWHQITPLSPSSHLVSKPHNNLTSSIDIEGF